jgi:GT2 family glycosyltransferase
MIKTTIIIVTYNSAKVVSKLLELFKGYEDKFRIIVVDNNSKDNIDEIIQEKYGFVELLKQDKNLGYGSAANIGLSEVKTKYGFLLNPDLTLNPEDIFKLEEYFDKLKETAILAPATEEHQYNKSQDADIENTIWLVGAALMFDMEKIKEIGFFDENFFLYYEETDLCKRALDAGYKLSLVRNIFFPHENGKSCDVNDKVSFLKYWHLGWSKMYYACKYSGRISCYRKIISYLLKFSVRYVLCKIVGNKEKSIKYKAGLCGCYSFMIGLKAFNENGNPRGLKN